MSNGAGQRRTNRWLGIFNLANLLTTTREPSGRGGVGGTKERWIRLIDGHCVDLCSMGYELKALNMHDSKVVDS